jgi:hypothetical protein
MTDNNAAPVTPTTPDQKPVTFVKKHKAVLITAVTALVVGGIFGASQVKETIVQVEGPTVTVTEEVAAASCLDALDSAEGVFGHVSEALENLGLMTRAIIAGQYSEVKELSGDNDIINENMGADRVAFNRSASDCRGE